MIQTLYHPWHSGLFLLTVGEHIQITTSMIFAQHDCLAGNCSRTKELPYFNYCLMYCC